MARLKRATDGHPVDEAEARAVLDALEGAAMTVELLRSTKVGKAVNELRKSAPALAPRAKALMEKWKQLSPQS